MHTCVYHCVVLHVQLSMLLQYASHFRQQHYDMTPETHLKQSGLEKACANCYMTAACPVT